MPLEVKEVLKALNLPEDIDTPEKLVESHGKTFVSLAEAHTDDRVVEKVTGKIYGPLNNLAKKTFGFTNEEIKDKKYEDIFTLGVSKFTKQIEELKNSDTDEKLKKVTSEFDAFKLTANQDKEALTVAGKKIQELEQGFESKIKEFKIEGILKDKKSRLPWAAGIGEVSREGFDSRIGKKYNFDLDDKENPLVLTKEGKKIPHPTKATEFLGVDDILKMELEEAGFAAKNNLKGGELFKFGHQQQENNNGGTGKKEFVPNPKAIKHAEMLAEKAGK